MANKVIDKIKRAGKLFFQGPDNVRSFTVPISFGPANQIPKAGSAIASGAKSAFNFVKTFAARKSINPAAGQTGVKNVAKTIGKSVAIGGLAGGLFQGGRLVSKSATTGDIPSFGEVSRSITKGVGVGAGLGASPLGGGLGFLEGGGVASARAAKNEVLKLFGRGQSLIDDATKINTPIFSGPLVDTNFPRGTMQDIIPQQPINLIMPSAGVGAPSFSVQGSLGGGSEILPLLLLLGAGAGAAGFALGRRKRKKKKYKKRKRR